MNNFRNLGTVKGDEENSQGETGAGSDGQEGNPPQTPEVA